MAREKHKTMNRIAKLMDKKGCQKLGNGIFGTVYTHPTDPKRVIKWGPLADGWVAFAAWVDAHRSERNKHLPVIFKLTRYERYGVYCAEMERLSCTVCEYVYKHPKSKWAGWDRLGRERFKYGIKAAGRDRWSDGVNMGEWAAYLSRMGNAETLEPTLVKLKDFAERHGLSKDLHDMNVMLRKQGRGYTLVITDPFSFGDPQPACEALKAAA